MQVIKFPFVLDAGDGDYYFVAVDTEEQANKLIEVSEDFGFMFDEPKLVDMPDNESAIYNAISDRVFPTLGFNTREELFKAYEEDPDLDDSHAYSLDGFEAAVIGVTEDGSRFVYDYNKMMEIMMTRDEMTSEEAFEWYSYNIERSFPYYQPCPIVLVSLCD